MAGGTLIVGASVAGAQTAQALRAAGYDRPITVLEREPDAPCDRPPLSKGVLAGTVAPVPLLSTELASALAVTIELGTPAVRLRDAHTVEASDGTIREFDHLVIATGADARRGPWGQGGAMHVLRTHVDAERLRAQFGAGRSLVIIGAGFIGCEVAATATAAGMTVTMLDPLEVPMARVTGSEIGQEILGNLAGLGVIMRLGLSVEDVVPSADRTVVQLSDGTSLDADVVLVGIGVTEQTGWLEGGPLTVSNGVTCDQYGRATGFGHIWAVGDVSRWERPNGETTGRVEHWTNAVHQAAVVAHNIVATSDLRGFDAVPYVWSDQGSWKIQIVGRPSPAAAIHRIGQPSDPAGFAAVYAAGGEVLGVVTINWPRACLVTRRALTAPVAAADLVSRLQDLRG
jgi:NADPH-dependent 2,4-dienoyl-CoA reductase/sulfur reductase-like enzyme